MAYAEAMTSKEVAGEQQRGVRVQGRSHGVVAHAHAAAAESVSHGQHLPSPTPSARSLGSQPSSAPTSPDKGMRQLNASLDAPRSAGECAPWAGDGSGADSAQDARAFDEIEEDIDDDDDGEGGVRGCARGMAVEMQYGSFRMTSPDSPAVPCRRGSDMGWGGEGGSGVGQVFVTTPPGRAERRIVGAGGAGGGGGPGGDAGGRAAIGNRGGGGGGGGNASGWVAGLDGSEKGRNLHSSWSSDGSTPEVRAGERKEDRELGASVLIASGES